jgi:single-strand DNA-binding protein
VKFFGRLAEIAGEYLKKGRQVYVQGSLRTEKYTDKDNIERFSTDVIATEMQMLGGNREDGGGNSGGHEGGASRGGGQQQRSQGGGGSSQRSQGGNQQRPAAQRAPALAGGFDDGMDQDVPF